MILCHGPTRLCQGNRLGEGNDHSRGENHFLERIENVVPDHADVAEISIIALPDDKWGETIATSVPREENMAFYE